MLNGVYCRNAVYSRQVHVGEGVEEPSTKEEMILRHLDLVKYIALRLAPRLPGDISVDDLFNSGIIGLMDAIDKFDPSQQIQFKTYAKIRIKGAMLDEMRAMDWIPRSLRQKSSGLEHTFAALEKKLGRPPADEEVAGELGVSLDDYFKLLDEIKSMSVLPMEILDALQETQTEGQLGLHGENPLQSIYRQQIRQRLAEAISSLSKNEQLVLSLYYYEELTMKEIGVILGYTESRISQLHTKAVLRLRSRLTRSCKKEELLDFS
jgi:RNA polymerase sigma factor for flagellar operon FliA